MALSNDDVESRLGDLINVKLKPNQNPIVFSNDYEISFAGIERWYPLDTCKGGNALKLLKELGLLTDRDVTKPKEATCEHLSMVHTKHFLENINLMHVVEGLYSQAKDTKQNGRLSDLPSLALLPSFIVNSKLLRPFRFQVGGSVLAAKLALEWGWSINLGGGFSHCYPRRSGGFSPYSDVTLAVTYLLEKVDKVMIIDLSAQQCNGPERSFMHDRRIHVLDVYNRDIYPLDGFARRGISVRGELGDGCSSQQYLHTIRTKLEESLESFNPGFVLYLAGTDVLAGDAAGCMSISEEAIVERDQLIFLKMRSRGIPVCMLLGGGFSKKAHRVISRSIENLHNFGLITVSRSPEMPEEPEKKAESDSVHSTNEINKFTSYSMNDLRVADDGSKDGDKNRPDPKEDPHPESEFQVKGLIHRSKTFMGSLMSWTGWSKPQTIYQSLSNSDSLEEVDSGDVG